ncbi:MAG: NAD(P)-dependent alcohol dehydrogenase, partial [Prolixibacteraceae bacterium]|nr:NAD(P)-dependent alcohol dehydrogenase [Prolixibacteraceae bacterium]
MKEKMKAIVATGYGGPDVLKLQQVEKPQPKESEVLVKVYVSSATTADTMMRTGKPYFGRLITGLTKPKHTIPGTGFAGVVEAVGKNVKNFKSGDRVFGETTLEFSTNAEYFTMPETGVILPLPVNMSYADGATYGDGHITSYNFLKEIAHVKPDQSVLINGASGSLGTAAVQIAKHLGAKVTGVCSTRNVGLVKSLGADNVIDYTKTDFTKVKET